MLGMNLQPSAHPGRLSVGFARNTDEVEEAQRLRYRVFAEERSGQAPSTNGLDSDLFDRHCDHLLAREGDSHKVVGTCRILPPDRAQMLDGYEAEAQFDLERLANFRDQMVEVGRFCVAPEHRNGATFTQLWSCLTDHTMRDKYQYLIACVSIGMKDGGHYAASLFRTLYRTHAAPRECCVFPYHPLPLAALNQSLEVEIPQLIKGYLRLGAYIGGEPAWNPETNTADIFILLPRTRMNSRFALHFMP